MLGYLQRMLDLALDKQLQGIHFWGTVYTVLVLAGSLWHVLRVRRWPGTPGELLRLGVRPIGGAEPLRADQAFVPDALYAYQVDGQRYEGSELSVWKLSASGLLRSAAALQPRQVRAVEAASGVVTVYYNPRRPHKSLLVRPGWASVCFMCCCIAAVAGFYLWRW
ncbi:MAG: hypothetical protein C0423_14505 [Methylibium sp.]|nr:hypothetical protein [Methylibium sp.]